jgi:hypothetical protein
VHLCFLFLVVRLAFPMGSTQVFQLHLWQWPQYLTLFGLGVTFARLGYARHVPDEIRRAAGRLALGGLLAVPLLAAIAGVADLDSHVAYFNGGWHWQAAAAALIEGALAGGASVWLLGIAESKLAFHGRVAAAAGRSAFAAYVVQAPVLLAVAVACRTFPAPAEIKMVVVGVLGVLGCYLLAWALVTRTPVGRVL